MGGEKRKILFARVYLEIQRNHPSLVIFDEPTYAIEPQVAHVIEILIQMVSQDRIVIIISHHAIKNDSNTIYVHLNNGQLT